MDAVTVRGFKNTEIKYGNLYSKRIEGTSNIFTLGFVFSHDHFTLLCTNPEQVIEETKGRWRLQPFLLCHQQLEQLSLLI